MEPPHRHNPQETVPFGPDCSATAADYVAERNRGKPACAATCGGVADEIPPSLAADAIDGSDGALGQLPTGPCDRCGGGSYWRLSVLSGGPVLWTCCRCQQPDPAAWVDSHAVPAAQTRPATVPLRPHVPTPQPVRWQMRRFGMVDRAGIVPVRMAPLLLHSGSAPKCRINDRRG